MLAALAPIREPYSIRVAGAAGFSLRHESVRFSQETDRGIRVYNRRRVRTERISRDPWSLFKWISLGSGCSLGGLKPHIHVVPNGAAEAAPLQRRIIFLAAATMGRIHFFCAPQ